MQKKADMLHYSSAHWMSPHAIALLCEDVNEVSLCDTSNKVLKGKKFETHFAPLTDGPHADSCLYGKMLVYHVGQCEQATGASRYGFPYSL